MADAGALTLGARGTRRWRSLPELLERQSVLGAPRGCTSKLCQIGRTLSFQASLGRLRWLEYGGCRRANARRTGNQALALAARTSRASECAWRTAWLYLQALPNW